MQDKNQKEQYSKAVSMFLAELLRTHKIKLERAAEIAQKVLQNINLIDSEERFLRFIKELSSDFEELFHLHSAVFMQKQFNTRKDLEQKVRSFVIFAVNKDLQLASKVLEEATRHDIQLSELKQKFPEFKEFLEKA